MPKQEANRDANYRVRRPTLTIDESSGEGELIIEPTSTNPIRFICRFKPDVERQVEALKFLISYIPSNIAVPETPSKPETAPPRPPAHQPKPSARTKRRHARFLKEQRTTQAESAAEEADA